MSFMYFEGTRDYIAATPAIITTFKASGSITAGRFVAHNSNFASNDPDVYLPASSVVLGAVQPAGLALNTCSDGDPCAVLVFGYAKNIATATATAFNCGDMLTISGSGYAFKTGSAAVYATKFLNVIGKVITGSTTSVVAFINAFY